MSTRNLRQRPACPPCPPSRALPGPARPTVSALLCQPAPSAAAPCRIGRLFGACFGAAAELNTTTPRPRSPSPISPRTHGSPVPDSCRPPQPATAAAATAIPITIEPERGRRPPIDLCARRVAVPPMALKLLVREPGGSLPLQRPRQRVVGPSRLLAAAAPHEPSTSRLHPGVSHLRGGVYPRPRRRAFIPRHWLWRGDLCGKRRSHAHDSARHRH